MKFISKTCKNKYKHQLKMFDYTFKKFIALISTNIIKSKKKKNKIKKQNK